MAVIWNLRELLKQQGFKRASEIAKVLYDRTGYRISTQAVCDLLNGEPKMLRTDTARAFCDAFGLRLGDFFEILPGPPRKLQTMQMTGSEPTNAKGCQRVGTDSDGKPQPLDSSANEAELGFSSFFFAAGELACSKQSTVNSRIANSI